MNWKINEKQEEPPHQSWRFSYFGESSAEQMDTTSPPRVDQLKSRYFLSQAVVNERLWLVGFQGKGGIEQLSEMGLTLGQQLQIVSCKPSGSVVVKIQDKHIGVGAGIAQKIIVSDKPLPEEKEKKIQTFLREMSEGKRCRVVGYDKARWGYKGKLMLMGLTPGTEFTVIRVTPIEILVGNSHLSLGKPEADALVVETVESDD